MNYQPRLSDSFPGLVSGPLPSAPYWSDEYFDKEVEKIFKKTWLLVGNVTDLREPNSYFVHDIPICKASVIIARGQDGLIRGFHNSCAHRGTALLFDKRGQAPRFRCVYHGWLFASDGTLRGVPDEAMFADLDKAKCSLAQVHLEIWKGMIFISLSKETPPPLNEFLGRIGQRLSAFPFEEFSSRTEWETTVDANWKVCAEAFQEVYHVNFLHGGSFGQLFKRKDTPIPRAPYADLAGYHRQLTVTAAGDEYNVTPAAQSAARFGGKATLRTEAVENPPGVNPSGAPRWATETVGIFPHTVLILVADGYVSYTFWPLAVNKTLFVARRYYRPAKTPGARFAQEYSKAFTRNVFTEDCGPIEYVQKGLESTHRDVVFSDQEIACRHQYTVVDDVVNDRELRF